jgi:muconolactone delta-isomerase
VGSMRKYWRIKGKLFGKLMIANLDLIHVLINSMSKIPSRNYREKWEIKLRRKKGETALEILIR